MTEISIVMIWMWFACLPGWLMLQAWSQSGSVEVVASFRGGTNGRSWGHWCAALGRDIKGIIVLVGWDVS